MRPCLEPGCRELVASGRCAAHQRQQRGRRALTYSEHWWRRWREHYVGELVLAGVLPICGARLPTARQDYRTACQQAGLITFVSDDGSGLQLHHEPALSERDALDRHAVCDSTRVVMACRSCHSVRTRGGAQICSEGDRENSRARKQPCGDWSNDPGSEGV
jgi:hypothetical protein